jgi:hypothetical protein
MEITATIKRIEPTEQITDNFKKRRLIVDYDESGKGKFPQVIEFVLSQKNVEMADVLNPGDEIKILFNLRGRETSNKDGKKIIFNTLEIWRIDVIKKSIDYAETTVLIDDEPGDDTDSLPF